MTRGYSEVQQKLFQAGPFAGQIDPFAEAARYFHPIHGEMMSALLSQLQIPLMQRGYVAGRETSLQIAEGREPDIFVRLDGYPSQQRERWDYDTAAAEVLAEPGVVVDVEDDLGALHIREAESGTLVTVLEIVSPGNKTQDYEILAYRERRSRLLLEQGVNVVELDATRSLKRLTMNPVTQTTAYHVAIYLPGESVRIVEVAYQQTLKRIALPLRADVMAVELHEAYTQAYSRIVTAWHIEHEGRYTEADLPLPTTLTDEQRQAALESVERWRAALRRVNA